MKAVRSSGPFRAFCLPLLLPSVPASWLQETHAAQHVGTGLAPPPTQPPPSPHTYRTVDNGIDTYHLPGRRAELVAFYLRDTVDKPFLPRTNPRRDYHPPKRLTHTAAQRTSSLPHAGTGALLPFRHTAHHIPLRTASHAHTGSHTCYRLSTCVVFGAACFPRHG